MLVCSVRLANISDVELAAIDVLEPSERVRMERITNLLDRRRFMMGRRLARELVADITRRMPMEVVVRMRCVCCGSEAHGKPFAVYPGGTLPISIAHSAEWVLVAVTPGPDVGADIEIIDESRFDERVLGQIESPLERGLCPRHGRAFTRLWVHKEAVLKCTGDGFMRSPSSFAINFSCNPPTVVGWTSQSASPIALATLDVADGYLAAVAVRGTRKLRIKKR